MSLSDLEIRKVILDDLEEVARRKGFEKVDTVPAASGRIQGLDLALKKGTKLLVVQIRMYGWGGSEVVDARSLFPLLFQFEDIKKSGRFGIVKGLVVSTHEFDEKAEILAKDFGVNVLKLFVNINNKKVEKTSINAFKKHLF